MSISLTAYPSTSALTRAVCLAASPSSPTSSWAVLSCHQTHPQAYLSRVAPADTQSIAPEDAVLPLGLFQEIAAAATSATATTATTIASLPVTLSFLSFDPATAQPAAQAQLRLVRASSEVAFLLHPRVDASRLRAPLTGRRKALLKALRDALLDHPLLETATPTRIVLPLEGCSVVLEMASVAATEGRPAVIGRDTTLDLTIASSLLALPESTSPSQPLFIPFFQVPLRTLEMNFQLSQSSLGSSSFVLISGPHGSGKTTLAAELCRRTSVPCHVLSCLEVQPGDTKAEARLQLALCKAAALTPCILVVDDMEWMSSDVSQQLTALLTDASIPRRPVFVLGIAQDAASLPLTFRKQAFFGKEIHLSAVHQDDRAALLALLLEHYSPCTDGTVRDALAAKAAPGASGFVLGDFHRLVRTAIGHAQATAAATAAATAVAAATEDGACGPAGVTDVDLRYALEHTRPSILQHFDVGSPKWTWADVGGYEGMRRKLGAVLALLKGKTFKSIGMDAPSGLLLYGPSGCGKTLLVHALMSEVQLPFIQVKAISLISKYLGETEANIRSLFKAARAARPCVVFIDEIDSVSARRGKSSSSSGVEERALSQLLNEIDGIDDSEGVFVVGCTNRPKEELDEAILRPGRLELHEEVGYPSVEDRKAIIDLVARRTPLEEGVDTAWLAAATQGYSCAKITHLFRASGMLALEEGKDKVLKAHLESAMRQLVLYK